MSLKRIWRALHISAGASCLFGLLVLLAGALPVLAQLNPPMSFKVNLPLIARADQPAPTPTPIPDDWLSYVNYQRSLANLPPVAEDTTWSEGDRLHARYMVKNNVIAHDEDPNNQWYTPEGRLAAQNSNLMVSSSAATSDFAAIDLWMQGPFHSLGIIDPKLLSAGFGSYRENDGGFQMGAGLDVLRGRGAIPASVSFPILWPADGKSTQLNAYKGNEAPDPLTGCPGYTAPSGLPLILQIGAGDLTPQVSAHSFTRDGQALEHCVFDETSYTNPNSSYQDLGRSILGARDAIVLIPRAPLLSGATYHASITSNGTTYNWSFSVSGAVQQAPLPAELRLGEALP